MVETFKITLEERDIKGELVRKVGAVCKKTKENTFQCDIKDDKGNLLATLDIDASGGEIKIFSKEGEITVDNMRPVRVAEVGGPVSADFEY